MPYVLCFIVFVQNFKISIVLVRSVFTSLYSVQFGGNKVRESLRNFSQILKYLFHPSALEEEEDLVTFKEGGEVGMGGERLGMFRNKCRHTFQFPEFPACHIYQGKREDVW